MSVSSKAIRVAFAVAAMSCSNANAADLPPLSTEAEATATQPSELDSAATAQQSTDAAPAQSGEAKPDDLLDLSLEELLAQEVT